MESPGIAVFQNDRTADSFSYGVFEPRSLADMERAVEIVNSGWKDLFSLDRKIFEKRLESGHLFFAARHNGKPACILETLALKIGEPEFSEKDSPNDRAKYIGSQIRSMGNYFDITNGGNWFPYQEGSNVVLFVDITSHPDELGGPAASGLVNHVKSRAWQKLEERPRELEHLNSVKYMPTYTPDIFEVIRWHKGLFALDTDIIIPKARPTYTPSKNVHMMCYMAPGYTASVGQVKRQKKPN